MRELFFTADTHFGHARVIEYTGRPFKSAAQMDEMLIKQWNSVVGANDVVYHLGDVGLCAPSRLVEILEQLKGTIHLIQGNHDKSVHKPQVREHFATVQPMLELSIPDTDVERGMQLIVLCHYKMATWNKKHWGSFHCFGHSHGAIPDDPNERSLDVGVDCWGYTPVSYEQIKTRMANKIWTPSFRSREASREGD